MADQKKPDSVCTRTRGKFGYPSENETLGIMTVYFQTKPHKSMELLLHGKVRLTKRFLPARLMLLPILIMATPLHLHAESYSRKVAISSKNISAPVDIHGQVT